MRRFLMFLFFAALAASLAAQPRRVLRRMDRSFEVAETAVKNASERLGGDKEELEHDLEGLMHLRAADQALTDDMQPTASIQKAIEHVGKATSSDRGVVYGIDEVKKELDRARLSPSSADFGRLRSLLDEHATGPASRVVTRNALELQQEILAWIKVQQLISEHLRQASTIAGESLRTVQAER